MWIDRRLFDALLADRDELQRLRGANTALESQVTKQQTQLESLITILNTSNTDRSALMQRVLDVGIPVATFAREDAPRESVPADVIGQIRSNLPDRSLPMPSAAGGTAALDQLADVFADVGDERAREMRLAHAATGEVVDAGTGN